MGVLISVIWFFFVLWCIYSLNMKQANINIILITLILLTRPLFTYIYHSIQNYLSKHFRHKIALNHEFDFTDSNQRHVESFTTWFKHMALLSEYRSRTLGILVILYTLCNMIWYKRSSWNFMDRDRGKLELVLLRVSQFGLARGNLEVLQLHRHAHVSCDL